jgi:hypothetical protein
MNLCARIYSKKDGRVTVWDDVLGDFVELCPHMDIRVQTMDEKVPPHPLSLTPAEATKVAGFAKQINESPSRGAHFRPNDGWSTKN